MVVKITFLRPIDVNRSFEDVLVSGATRAMYEEGTIRVVEEIDKSYVTAFIGIDGKLVEHRTELPQQLAKKLRNKKDLTEKQLVELEVILFQDLRGKHPIVPPETKDFESALRSFRYDKKYAGDGRVYAFPIPRIVKPNFVVYRTEKF
ncbi:MAG TPA: hypothetical protein VJB90_02405 [Candidatus Nanoarchaeia archaeon]|nr:hypothetical protein [Candidatus Nanoarchaeia archaeon]